MSNFEKEAPALKNAPTTFPGLILQKSNENVNKMVKILTIEGHGRLRTAIYSNKDLPFAHFVRVCRKTGLRTIDPKLVL
jgi:hypothetical protein